MLTTCGEGFVRGVGDRPHPFDQLLQPGPAACARAVRGNDSGGGDGGGSGGGDSFIGISIVVVMLITMLHIIEHRGR